MIDLKKKTAIVTGAGKGIGSGIASTMARLGASVALVDVDGESVAQVAERLAAEGGRAKAFPADVLDRGALAGVVDSVRGDWGQVDILVNNAGIIRDNFLEKITEADWDAVLGVNLKGAFLACQAVVPHMKERGYGKIVNIISRSWLGNVGQSNYAASKGGLVSLTRTLALELARDGINVNGVSPGMVDTPMTRALPDKVVKRLLSTQPMGEMGTVDDIAHAVCFLASDEARLITGQILHVDGGKSCGLLSL
ncbi:MAG: 3-oxoacyl-ACP reductase FabG [Candidatus Krumholzibacteria bacterium]